jgi:dihydrolipoamide dehydrogenase
MNTSKYDVVVIGAGPAGYTAAIRASQMGADTAIVEKGKLGGACLNWACIPTKFLVHYTDIVHAIKSSHKYGIDATLSNLNWNEMQKRKDSTISIIADGLEGLIKSNNIEIIRGNARFTGSNSIEVINNGQPIKYIAAKNIIISTGSNPKNLDTDNQDLLHFQDLISLEYLPASLVIIGGGAAGIEFASVFARLGCHVSLIEIMPHILPAEDAEITSILECELKREGIQLFTSAEIKLITNSQHGKLIKLAYGHKEVDIEAELVVVGIGQIPYFEGLGLPATGVTSSKHGIAVDEHMSTGVPGIYAAGDVTGKHMLAHIAIAQGKTAAENAMGFNTTMDYKAVPRCVFSRPEFAAAGITETEAIKQGYTAKCGNFPFAAIAAATIHGERRGIVKLVSDASSNKILGVHILGQSASNLIAEGVLAIQMGATAEDLEKTIHAHPTLSEAMWDAAMDINGRSINLKR